MAGIIKTYLSGFLSRKNLLWETLIAALVIRIAWVLCINVTPTSDYQWYYERALSIASGHGYAIENQLTAYWPAGYPYFLGIAFFLTGCSAVIVLILNAVMDTACIYLLYRIAKELGMPERPALLVALFFCIYLNHIAYCALFCSEIPFLFFFLSGYYLLSHLPTRNNFFIQALSGICFAIAVLIKPIVIFLPLLYLFLFMKKGTRLRVAVIHYLIIIIGILPVTVRNYQLYHEFIPLSLNSSVNLFIGSNPYANGTYRYDDAVMSLIGRPTEELTESKRAMSYAIGYVKEHPLHVLSLIPRKIYYQYVSDVDGLSSNLAGLGADTRYTRIVLKISRLGAQVVYMAVMGLFFIAILLKANKSNVMALVKDPILLPVLYFFVMYLPFFGAPRFHYVMMPFIVLFAADYYFVPQKNSQ